MPYLKSIAYLLLAIAVVSCKQTTHKKNSINLIPEAQNSSPDYWCTWGAQNYAIDSFSIKHTLSLGGHSVTAGYLTEKNVFGEKGWSETLPELLKQDLILLFDLGWDVPAGQKFESAQWMLGSLMVADDKFPSCTGNSLGLPAKSIRPFAAEQQISVRHLRSGVAHLWLTPPDRRTTLAGKHHLHSVGLEVRPLNDLAP